LIGVEGLPIGSLGHAFIAFQTVDSPHGKGTSGDPFRVRRTFLLVEGSILDRSERKQKPKNQQKA
jgi:hypothetical protein